MKLADHIKAKYILGLANIAYVQDTVAAAIAALIDSSPGTLNTLNELAAALGDDPNFATTVTNSIATKAPLTGAGTSGTWTISITGNAATATTATSATSATQAAKLTTARLIGGTSFDGTADITPALVTAATKLNTARTIGGTPFDGTANIAVALAATATALATPRAINGVNFDGTAPITINAVDSTARVAKAGDTMSGLLNIAIASGGNSLISRSGGATETYLAFQTNSGATVQGYVGGSTALVTGYSTTQGMLLRGEFLAGLAVGDNQNFSVIGSTGQTNAAVGKYSTPFASSNRSTLQIHGVSQAVLGFGVDAAPSCGYIYHTGTDLSIMNVNAGQLQLGAGNTAIADLSPNLVNIRGSVLAGQRMQAISTNSPTAAQSGAILRVNSTITLPTSPEGTHFLVSNYSGSSLTLTVASGTLYWVTTTGNRSLATGHLYWVFNIDGTNWILQDKSGIF